MLILKPIYAAILYILEDNIYMVGGAMASWLVRSTPERAGDIALCSWARHFTLWVPANLILGGNPAID